jgi:hypothetical protein
MSSYSMNAASVAPITAITAGQISQIDLGAYTFGNDKKLPNKKVSIDVHTAHGGYVVKVTNGHGVEDDMYVISDGQDLGAELGKIITHHTLKS